ncbi:MAG: MBL fold metallo-hydrolase, partial [Dehalococcoidales bacterium]|nr:MBL fold metallo-hydrolase [Dehalococcoidales bacterium]
MKSSNRKLLQRYALLIGAVIITVALYYLFDDHIDLLLDESTDGKVICTFIDVGQGDSTLITYQDCAILIDAGDEDAWPAIRKVFRAHKIQKIDLLVATHPHADHIGSMDDVLKNIPVDKIAMSCATPDTLAFERLLDAIDASDVSTIFPSSGDVLTYDGIMLQILHPNSDAAYDNLNNYSLVIRLVTPYGTALFTGDAETSAENEILTTGHDVNVDVLKVGHHGSSTSTSASFLEASAPQYSVIHVGIDNDYGHPSNKVL